MICDTGGKAGRVIMTSRRRFLAGLFVAPAIVAVSNIMPVKSLITLADIEWELLVKEWFSKGFDRQNFLTPSNFQPTTPKVFQPGTFQALIKNAQQRPDYDLKDDLLAAFEEHGL